jgi:predicted helicase
MLKRHPGLKLPKIRVPKAGRAEGEEVDLSPDEFFVMILDIATGTATFLVEVIEVIFQHLKAKWEKHGLQGMPIIRHSALHIPTFKDYWNEYVPAALLPRLYGYELMMAPYTIAHMKLALKFSEINARLGQPDYEFKFEGRAHIYLTNTLEPASGFQTQQFADFFPALAHEAAAVNAVKRSKRFTVVIGNPPYSVSSQNDGQWIISLCKDFKKGLQDERNIQPLSDDYIKFLRLALFLLEQSHCGTIGMITNREYIQGIIHRAVRSRLLDAAAHIAICDLHGQRGELLPEGVSDQNVFEIEKGVAISIIAFLDRTSPRVTYREVIGPEPKKTAILAGSVSSALVSQELHPSAPHFFFKPWKVEFRNEYASMPSLLDFFARRPVTGFATHRDHFAIDFAKETLARRISRFLDPSVTDTVIESEFGLGDTRDWHLHHARIQARRDTSLSNRLVRCTYRPFDTRWVIYSDDILEFSRRDAMQHVSRKIPALICSRIVKDEEYAHVFISQHPVEKIFLSPKSSNNAQICLSGEVSGGLSSLAGVGESLAPPPSIRLPFHPTSEDLLFYICAALHSPAYRRRYAEFLKIDFPRLPVTRSLELFRALAYLGGELVALHLLESPKLDTPITEFIGGRSPEVEKVSWSKHTVWLDKAQTTGFKGVREDVWNFHIGGYQVCEKWLKDRKGRTLSADDRAHYQKIVIALSETIRLMAEIDAVIEKHGGWPLK